MNKIGKVPIMELLREGERDITNIKQVKIPTRNCSVCLEGTSLLGEDTRQGAGAYRVGGQGRALRQCNVMRPEV